VCAPHKPRERMKGEERERERDGSYIPTISRFRGEVLHPIYKYFN